MKERAIIFSGPMVRAILEGRKTQTRRVVKPQPDDLDELWRDIYASNSPYGQPGDRLWVRETFRIFCNVHDGGFPEDHFPCECRKVDAYRATIEHPETVDWRSPIFMPRWASRLLLEVVSVRVERLQEISEADARAEGVEQFPGSPYWKGETHPKKGVPKSRPCARDAYQDLWESINGKGSWEANPWVWVVEFKRVGGEPWP